MYFLYVFYLPLGVYGDQILEMSWAVGEIIDLLNDLDLSSETLVVFLSDHGPHRENCIEGGHTGMLKGRIGKNI